MLEVRKMLLERHHRLFVVGVGLTANHNMLQKVATVTGGAYEAVLPNEDLEGVVLRMVSRMRERTANIVSMSPEGFLQSTTLFPGETTTSAYAGDAKTFEVVFTRDGMTKRVTVDVERSFTAKSAEGRDVLKLAHHLEALQARRSYADVDVCERLGILSPDVNFILVKERAADEKVDDLVLQQVPQMHAAHIGDCRMYAMPEADDEDSSRLCDMRGDICEMITLTSVEPMIEDTQLEEVSLSVLEDDEAHVTSDNDDFELIESDEDYLSDPEPDYSELNAKLDSCLATRPVRMLEPELTALLKQFEGTPDWLDKENTFSLPVIYHLKIVCGITMAPLSLVALVYLAWAQRKLPSELSARHAAVIAEALRLCDGSLLLMIENKLRFWYR